MSTLKHRMTLELADSAAARLDELQRRTDAASRAEVIRRSLEIYGALANAADAGGRVVVVLPDGSSREIVVPEFARPASVTLNGGGSDVA